MKIGIVSDSHGSYAHIDSMLNHKEALKYILELKNAKFENIVGIDFISKQTLITEKNPYISNDEYIKRFLWE